MRRQLHAFVASGLLLALATHASAQELDGELTRCAALESDLDRLACFDRVARRYGLAPTEERVRVEGAGKWLVKEKTNPLDDTRTVVLSLPADEGRSRWGDPIYLHLLCTSGNTESYIDWGTYLGQETFVKSRMGSQTATGAEWNLSTDQKGSFYPRGSSAPHGLNPRYFVMALTTVDTFVAQTTPYSENPIIAVFDVRGLEHAMVPLLDACRWSPAKYLPEGHEQSETSALSAGQQSAFEAVVASNERVTRCFSEAEKRDQLALSPIPFRLVIDEDGAISNAEVLDAGYRGTYLGECLQDKVTGIRFTDHVIEPGDHEYAIPPPGAD